ncbi:hypothetical protein HMPREF3232_00207 [Fannyhessea vaginae]|nr:hypothetical protein HMPREF3232_00207 [Fannyhessea vaginae]
MRELPSLKHSGSLFSWITPVHAEITHRYPYIMHLFSVKITFVLTLL